MNDNYTFNRVKHGNPPVRFRRKKSFWQTTGWPIMKTVVIAFAVVTMAGLFWDRLAQPVKSYRHQSTINSRLEKQNQELHLQNQELARQEKYLRTPEGAAQAARKLGWVKPGEITLVLPDETTSTKTQKNSK